jgi:urease accessory protein
MPLHIGRVHHPQPEWRDLAQLMVTMPTGGLVQGDEVALEVLAHPGARVHLTSQSATRAYRCPGGPISQRIMLKAEGDALLEWWPDPLIPYAGASVEQRIELVADARAVLLVADCWLAGRIARGELHAYSSLRLDVRARRPDGKLLYRDSVRLSGVRADVATVGQLGDARAMGSFFLLGPDLAPELERPLAEALQAELPGRAGVTRLPNEAGLLVRLLSRGSDELRRGQRLVLALVRQQLGARGPGYDPKN